MYCIFLIFVREMQADYDINTKKRRWNSMQAKLIAAGGGVSPTAGDCWGLGYIPDPGKPGGICFAGFMPGL
jgi:hypothetical protein